MHPDNLRKKAQRSKSDSYLAARLAVAFHKQSDKINHGACVGCRSWNKNIMHAHWIRYVKQYLWWYEYDEKCNRYQLVTTTVDMKQLHVTSYPSCCNVLPRRCGTQAMEALLQHFTNTLKWRFVVWSDSSQGWL